ncbi:hypothetical protein [Geodermatophilus sabuli]|uniref:hypothetical protein n=1 Tax=Geodermatophilus sabuli TaxID=1564158 RepID=UPI00117B59CF|nr:hypothetical protein [Geodermatophilus sabuli]MBB3086733.1 fibronectin type 3 domain-containing protein [Geodermatophilus sabuli]
MVAVVTAVMAAPAQPAGAAWSAGLADGSQAHAHAGSLTAPTEVTASCVSPTGSTIQLAWPAAAGATSYTVSQATSPNGTFTTIATGVTNTIWTSGARTDGFEYYYRVAAARWNWSSAPSTTTAKRYVAQGNCS